MERSRDVYLHVIEDIARVQIDAVGLLVNSHYCAANIQGTLDSSSEDLDEEHWSFWKAGGDRSRCETSDWLTWCWFLE